jgi:hypothetical protein
VGRREGYCLCYLNLVNCPSGLFCMGWVVAHGRRAKVEGRDRISLGGGKKGESA